MTVPPVSTVDASPQKGTQASVEDRGAFRRELRGTLTIILALVGILATGWLGTLAVGRERVTLGPGVTIVIRPTWSESAVGAMGLLSSTRRIGRSVLNVSQVFEESTPAELLALYHREVMEIRLPHAVLQEPEIVPHAAGGALRQSWSARDPDGTLFIAELLVVAKGQTGVILDARWPEDEDPAVIEEINRVVSSLQIEPLSP